LGDADIKKGKISLARRCDANNLSQKLEELRNNQNSSIFHQNYLLGEKTKSVYSLRKKLLIIYSENNVYVC
jgi:hypothetical protein